MTYLQHHSRHKWLLPALVGLFIAALILTGPAYTPTAEAKGPVKSGNSSSSESSNSGSEQKPDPPKQEAKPSPPPQQKQESRSSSGSSVFGGRTETRDEPRADRDSSPSERRDEGTPSVFGQIQKRDERRDPEYEYRRHYHDSFYYPYDRQFWSRYPYYNRGTVIIIDDSWRNPRRQWRREYSYRSPLPGSLEEALVDIEATWWEREPEFLMWHIDSDRSVDIHYKGEFSHRLTAREIYKLTAEALDQIRTTEFRITSVERGLDTAKAKAIHEFDGPDGKHRTARLIYYLEEDGDRWIIRKIDFNKTDYGSPKCFIATAAYGTAMEEEVLALRQFRDRYLLPNPVGKELVDLYYKISPPIAASISESDDARAFVRVMLWPIVQTCKVLVGN